MLAALLIVIATQTTPLPEPYAYLPTDANASRTIFRIEEGVLECSMDEGTSWVPARIYRDPRTNEILGVGCVAPR